MLNVTRLRLSLFDIRYSLFAINPPKPPMKLHLFGASGSGVTTLGTAEDLKPMLNLPQKETEEFLRIARKKTVNKHEFFIRNGEVPQKLGFVLSGLFRYVYFDASGNEFTKSLIPEANFITSYSAMINKHGSYFAIQALEDSTILEIDYQQWLSLKEGNPVWNGFLITLLEKAFAIKEKRERDLVLLDAETRYQNFLDEFPRLENRVKQHIIASYLGIKPESLSRIRKKIVS